MRVAVLDDGHRLPVRMMFRVTKLLFGEAPPDIVKVLYYRQKFFGEKFSRALHAVMHGPSDWSIGERELFAAFTSRVNQCPY